MAVTYSQNGVIVRQTDGPHYGSVTIGGCSYKTIVMPDGKEWLAENLDYKWTGLDIGSAGTPSTQAAWYYNNDEASYGINGTYKCGLLYNWYAVDYLETNKSTLLPVGWHIPSKSEYASLFNSLKLPTYRGLLLKAVDESVTQSFPSSFNGLDYYGFGVLPTGSRASSFVDIGTTCRIWELDDSGSNAYYLYFYESLDGINENTDPKYEGKIVRLVRDAT